MHYMTVWAIVAYVESRVREAIDLQAMAFEMGFSASHLKAVFVRHYGRPLGHYVRSRRIAHAARDIARSNDTLLTIALRYQFSGPDTFTRAFHRETGMTPSAFRKAKGSVGHIMLCTGMVGPGIHKKGNEP